MLGHVRQKVMRGLLLVLPLLITLWLLSILFEVINAYVTPWVQQALEWAGMPGIERWFARNLGVPVIGLFLTGLFIYLLGLFAGYLAGRRLVTMVESWILRIPLVKGVYGPARQLIDAFGSSGRKTFSKVLLLEYPRPGLWGVGFVTAEEEHRIPGIADDAHGLVPVFLPTTPNPTSGWMLLAQPDQLVILDMTIEDGMKLIVSGGIVCPDNLASLARRWTLPARAPARP